LEGKINTNTWTNTFDLIEPTSSIIGSVNDETENTLILSLDGFDEGSGIRSYTIYVSVNDSAYVSLPSSNQKTYSYPLPSENANLKFFSIAMDSLGHEEIAPTGYDIDYTHTVISTAASCIDDMIRIYPNPTSGIVTVEGENIIAIKLLDAKGSVLIQKQDVLESNTISLNLIPKGLYFIRITTDQGQLTKKLIYQ